MGFDGVSSTEAAAPILAWGAAHYYVLFGQRSQFGAALCLLCESSHYASVDTLGIHSTHKTRGYTAHT